MENYLKQLIDDIRQAGYNIKPPHEIWESADPDDEVEEEDFSYVEEYLYGEEIPVSDITGIDKDALPPANKLTAEQREQLSRELEKLLEVKHIELDFPTGFPYERRYGFFYEFWHKKHVEISFGTSHVELCDYDPDNCPYPDYCTCHEFREEAEQEFKKQQERNNNSNEDDDDNWLPGDADDLLPKEPF